MGTIHTCRFVTATPPVVFHQWNGKSMLTFVPYIFRCHSYYRLTFVYKSEVNNDINPE